MSLRPYQADAIARTRAALASGARSVLIVCPTGGGKTVIGAELARKAVANGRRVLWLAHRVELIAQATSTLERMVDDPVTVASLDTLIARGERPDADVVILDEAHHSASDTYNELMAHYFGRAVCIGLTATPQRGDGRGMGPAGWQRMVVVTTTRELIAQGALVPTEVIAPKAPLRPGQIAARPVDAYRAHANGTSALVYAPNLEAAEAMRTDFRDGSIRCELIHGGTPALTRAVLIEQFRAGVVPVLVNVGVLTEGTDLPIASTAILARGCGTIGLYLQIVGRVKRPYPGKTTSLLIDLRGVSHELGHPDEDRVFSLEGRGIRGRDEGADTTYCRVCGAPRVPDSTSCEECGTEAQTARPLKVVASPLEKWGHFRAQDAEQRAQTLARWLGVARAKGYREGWALAKYAAVYGARPGFDVIAAARGLA